jgi:pimeloyl-ACP methyl ester carboxylesterase
MSKAALTSDQALRSSYIGAFQVPVVPERVLLAGGGAALRRLLVQAGLPQEDADHYVARMREPGALTAALHWYRALPWSAKDPVGRVRVPTLHVWSSGDPSVGRTATEGTERFVDAPYRLEVLEGVPHWIPEVAAERTAELLVAHVRTA